MDNRRYNYWMYAVIFIAGYLIGITGISLLYLTGTL